MEALPLAEAHDRVPADGRADLLLGERSQLARRNLALGALAQAQLDGAGEIVGAPGGSPAAIIDWAMSPFE